MQHAARKFLMFMRGFALESQLVPVSVVNLIRGVAKNRGSLVMLLAALSACGRSTRSVPERISVWTVPAPAMPDSVARRLHPVDSYPGLGVLIALDSASLRPAITRRGGSGVVESRVNDSSWLEIHLDRPAFVGFFRTEGGSRRRLPDEIVPQTRFTEVTESPLPRGDWQQTAQENLSSGYLGVSYRDVVSRYFLSRIRLAEAEAESAEP